jgi:hypothetical protein
VRDGEVKEEQSQFMVEPGARIISEDPFFMVSNAIFDLEIMMTAYEQEKGKGKFRLCQRRIRAGEKLVYLYLKRCANNSDGAFPSYPVIADRCEISVRAAKAHVDTLYRSGLLQKNSRPGASNVYKLMTPHGTPRTSRTADKAHTISSSAIIAPPRTSSSAIIARGVVQSLHPINNHIKNKDQQQRIKYPDRSNGIADKSDTSKSVVENQPETQVEKQEEEPEPVVVEIMNYAASKGIEVSKDCARDFLAAAVSFERAIIAVDRAAVSALSKVRRREQIHNPAGLLFKALAFNSGAKLDLKNLDSERQKRLAEKEKKYEDIYLS